MRFKMKCCNDQNNKNTIDRWVLFTTSCNYWDLLKDMKR